MTRPKLYGWSQCPFVQRARMALQHKGIEHDHVRMDEYGYDKPDWFMKMNPLGQVPVLQNGAHIVYESSVILEYIEDTWPEPPMMPARNDQRALTRILIGYCDREFVGRKFLLLRNQDRDKHTDLLQRALDSWRWLNTFLERHSPESTLAFGDTLSMADAAFAPFFMRYAANRYYRYFELPDTADFARVKRWERACMALDVTRRTGMPEEHIIKLYHTHSQGWGAGKLPDNKEDNSLDPSRPFEERPMPPRPAPYL